MWLPQCDSRDVTPAMSLPQCDSRDDQSQRKRNLITNLFQTQTKSHHKKNQTHLTAHHTMTSKWQHPTQDAHPIQSPMAHHPNHWFQSVCDSVSSQIFFKLKRNLITHFFKLTWHLITNLFSNSLDISSRKNSNSFQISPQKNQTHLKSHHTFFSNSNEISSQNFFKPTWKISPHIFFKLISNLITKKFIWHLTTKKTNSNEISSQNFFQTATPTAQSSKIRSLSMVDNQTDIDSYVVIHSHKKTNSQSGEFGLTQFQHYSQIDM